MKHNIKCITLIVSAIIVVVTMMMSQYVYAQQQLNLSYNTLSKSQTLDVFYPDEESAKYPVVIFLHGGSFFNGDKADFENENKAVYLTNGYVYVGVNYRLFSEAPFPGALDDLKTAIRYLKANHVALKIDPQSIYIVGHSAGANIASQHDLTSGLEALGDEEIKYPEQTSKVRGIVSLAGFYDLKTVIKNENNKHFDVVVDKVKRYFKVADQKYLIRANSYNFVKNSQTPLLLIHGIGDKIIATEETINYCQALKIRADNDKVTCRILQNTSHHYSEFLKEVNQKIILEWLKNN